MACLSAESKTKDHPVCGNDCNGYCRFDKCVAYKREGEECNYSAQVLCATHLTCDMGSEVTVAPGSNGICKKMKVKTCENCGTGYCHSIKHKCASYRLKGETCNGSLDNRCAPHLFCDYPTTTSHKRRLQSLAGTGNDGICDDYDFSPNTTETTSAGDNPTKTTRIVVVPEFPTTESEATSQPIPSKPCPSNLFLSNSELVTDEECANLCARNADSCISSGKCSCVGSIQVSENAANGFSLAILLILPTLF